MHAVIRESGKKRQKIPDVHGHAPPRIRFLVCEVERRYTEKGRERLSKRPRLRGIGAGHRFAHSLRDRVVLFLFCHIAYVTQDVGAQVFGAGQVTVPRSLDQMAPVLALCLPTSERLCVKARRASTLEELEESFPGFVCLTDMVKRQILLPKRKDMEMSHFGKGGKAHRQGTIHHGRARLHRPPCQALAGTRAWGQGVSDEASLVSQEPCAPGREAESCESAAPP